MVVIGDLWLVMSHGQTLLEARAAVDLLKEVYGATCRGLAPHGLGLVYQTKRPVTPEDAGVLGVVPFE